MPRTVLFRCPHNVAKSVLAAAYFERLARERGLDYRAASAGTRPEAEIFAAVAAALQVDGRRVSGQRPRRVTVEYLANANRVVSLGCNPADLPLTGFPLDRWDDIPSASHDLDASRAAIRRRLDTLLGELVGDNQPQTAER